MRNAGADLCLFNGRKHKNTNSVFYFVQVRSQHPACLDATNATKLEFISISFKLESVAFFFCLKYNLTKTSNSLLYFSTRVKNYFDNKKKRQKGCTRF